MATRFNVPNTGGLPTGYQNEPTEDFTIPSCGIEDIDVGVFKLFEDELKLSVGKSPEKLTKVPVVFATGEKWAMLKRNEPLRDSTNTLILPIIAITRTGLSQTSSDDLVGRGINQQTGELIIKRKLDKSDRSYQSLINRSLLKNQLNVAVGQSIAIDGQIVSGRETGDLLVDSDYVDGGLLKQDKANNIWEVITIPTPQFITATYEILFWTQYTEHMNQLIETFMSSMLPWGMCWRIETSKGYWFVATLSDGSFNNESNFQEIDGERVIKWKVSLKVPAYVLATDNPSAPVPVRRYVSCPTISFDVSSVDPTIEDIDEDVSSPYLGDDDPTLPLDSSERSMRRRDMRQTNAGLQYTPVRTDEPYTNDPALENFPRGRKPARYTKRTINGEVKYDRIISVNKSVGETIFISDWDSLVIGIQK